MRATTIEWSLVALIPIYVLVICAAAVIARSMLRKHGGRVRIWVPPAIFMSIEVSQHSSNRKQREAAEEAASRRDFSLQSDHSLSEDEDEAPVSLLSGTVTDNRKTLPSGGGGGRNASQSRQTG
jgi:hypothetical protein